MTDAAILADLAAKTAYAVACGFLVGVERKVNDAPAAFKTQILVCSGAALFTTLPGVAGFGHETARVVAQVVSGVGFLGAGAILHAGNQQVLGLTTAAWIWFTAAVGVFIGAGHGAVALFVSAVLVGVVTVTRWIEHRFFGEHGATAEHRRRAA